MANVYFDSLVDHSLTVVTEHSESSSLMVNESQTYSLAPASGGVNLKLQLNDKDVNLEEMADLMANPKIPRVKFLELDSNEFGDAGVELLAGAESLANLQSLSLAHNKITDRGMRALAASPVLTRLQKLYLQHNGFGREGLQALADSPTLAGLTLLHLKANRLGPEGAGILAASPVLRNLEELYLQGTWVGGEGLQALWQSPIMASVKVLNLSYNNLDDRAVDYLVESQWPSRLMTLDLYGNAFGKDALAKLKALDASSGTVLLIDD